MRHVLQSQKDAQPFDQQYRFGVAWARKWSCCSKTWPFVALQKRIRCCDIYSRMIRTSLELPDLHSSRRGQDISRLSHQARGIDLCPRCNDFTLSNPLLLSSAAQTGGDFGTEDDILDQDSFDGHAPLVGNVAYNFSNFERNSFALSHNRLDRTCTYDVS